MRILCTNAVARIVYPLATPSNGNRNTVQSLGDVMDQDAIRSRLRRLAGTRKKVRVTRSVPCERLHNGFVLAVGRDWMLMRQFHDFHPEGLTALRIKDIISIRSGRYERLWEHMLAGEGLLDESATTDLPVDSLSQLLKALIRRKANVIIQCEDLTEDIEDFYIGRILAISNSSVRFANFDALGQWDEKPSSIRLDEITKLEIEAPYIRIFSKYLKKPCPFVKPRSKSGLGSSEKFRFR